jgi:hypothetical protein
MQQSPKVALYYDILPDSQLYFEPSLAGDQLLVTSIHGLKISLRLFGLLLQVAIRIYVWMQQDCALKG